MPISRRSFLQLAGLVAASASLTACAPVTARLAGGREPFEFEGWPPDLAGDSFGALSRLTFGPRMEERRRAAEFGLPAWIEEQLDYESVDDGALALRLHGFDTLEMSATELLDWHAELFDDLNTQAVTGELQRASLLRQIYSRRQLYEVMVEFWSDHFSISLEKGDCWFLKTVDDREVIRPHALGNFRDLLWASAHSPAMLVYLDNQANHKDAPNENYARELLELHTLGVHGGYTQADVMELARCLTGWTVKERFWRGEFTFDPDRHDTGPKRVLGIDILPEGVREAERVVEALAVHPGTARYVSGKLARRFLGDDVPTAVLERASAAFSATGGDIRAVLRAILLDGRDSLQPKFKRPVSFVVSALRMLNAQTDAAGLHDFLARLGQLPFMWPTPDGYPDTAQAWQANLMPRWQFALALARGEIEGTQINLDHLAHALADRSPAEAAARLSALLLGRPLPAERQDALLRALESAGAAEADLPALLTAGLIASPAFQWR